MQFYRVSGLSVASEIVLPGMIATTEARAPQVTIRRGPVPENLVDPSASGPTWQIAGQQFLLRIPEIARFLLIDGREIVFLPESEAATADVPIFILGTVFGILLHQREQVVLHASAVQVNGRAVLFCGASGAGKSTLAAALAQRGYPLVNDDVCTVTLAGMNAPTVYPDGRQLKLWAQAIERLDLARQRGERVRASLEKFYVEPSEVFSEPLALGAVYMLREARPPFVPGIEKPNIVDAALLLRRNAYRPLLVRRLDQKKNYFHAATAMANSAGIFHLTRDTRLRQNARGDRAVGAALARSAPDGARRVIRTIWLASYPKSGNTWFRMLVENLSAKDGKPVDINDLPERGGIASARGPFDHLLLIDSGLLTHDEIDVLRPRVYEELARGADDDEYDAPQDIPKVRFVKVHDAYTLTPKGEPLLAGRRGADGAIVIVRDPRDVAPSFANHNGMKLDATIALMNNRKAAFCAKPGRQQNQLRQKLSGWSGHIASWLDQTDIPVHLIRYEDMQADPSAHSAARWNSPAAWRAKTTSGAPSPMRILPN